MSDAPASQGIRKINSLIIHVRDQKVILDSELARLYGTETKRLNEQVRRNAERFPVDFAFQLTEDEVNDLRSQNENMRSHIATASRKRNVRFRPYVFTEHGALMAANVLRSQKAAEMSVFVVRAFVKMRQELLTRSELESRLDQIEKILLVHDHAVEDLYEQIRPLLIPPDLPPKYKKIGFQPE